MENATTFSIPKYLIYFLRRFQYRQVITERNLY